MTVLPGKPGKGWKERERKGKEKERENERKKENTAGPC